MNRKTRLLVVIVALLAAQLACNVPITQTADQNQNQEPTPNLTLTALFAVTEPPSKATATPTLPPIVTATPAAQQETATATNEPGNSEPTNTPAANPTATQKANATVAVPEVRPRAQVVAKYLSTPPTIDGDWSEWKDLTTEFPANSVVWGSANWTGDDDLSSSFHIGWDNNNLYVALKVRDDTYVQNARGENIYMGDSLELLLDTKLKEDFYTNRLSPDDFQLGISPGRPDPSGTKEAYLWLPANIAGARANVKIASKLEKGMYRVEAAIPWSVFELTPASGMHLGFALSVSDNDNPSANLQQSMVSNDPNRSLVDPTSWGDLQLAK